jgi:hypothetical protein
VLVKSQLMFRLVPSLMPDKVELSGWALELWRWAAHKPEPGNTQKYWAGTYIRKEQL